MGHWNKDVLSNKLLHYPDWFRQHLALIAGGGFDVPDS